MIVYSFLMKIFYTILYADDGLLFFNEDSDGVRFYCNEIGILSVNLNNVNLDNNWPSKLKDAKSL